MSASPGALGGLRGLVHVRAIFSGLGGIVLPDQVAIGRAFEAFDEAGEFVDEGNRRKISRLVESIVEVVRKLRS